MQLALDCWQFVVSEIQQHMQKLILNIQMVVDNVLFNKNRYVYEIWILKILFKNQNKKKIFFNFLCVKKYYDGPKFLTDLFNWPLITRLMDFSLR